MFFNSSLIAYNTTVVKAFTAYNSSIVVCVNTSIVNYVSMYVIKWNLKSVLMPNDDNRTLASYVHNLSYGAVVSSLVSFMNTSPTSLCCGAVPSSLVSFINTSLTSHSYGAVSSCLVDYV